MMNITGAYCNGKHLAIKTYEYTTYSVFFEKWFSQVLLPEVPDGFTDWFLPSKDELDMMYKNLKLMGWGSFKNTFYWSSSQANNRSSWLQQFTNGSWYPQGDNAHKSENHEVRAIRAF